MSPRWIKLLRDAQLARGRLAMIVVALAVSLAALVTMASTYLVMLREVPRNYIGTNPASAQLEMAGQIDRPTLDLIRRRPGIAGADLAATLSVRAEVAPGKWLPMRLFVVPDFGALDINRLHPESGAWPPLPDTLLIERSALALSGSAVGQPLTVALARSGRHAIPIGGAVHDPGLAPAWQEQVIYGYATPATLAALGEPVALDLLKIVVANKPDDAAAIEVTARALAAWLEARGLHVEEVRIPPPRQHPHQSQMNAVLFMLLAFSVLVLILGAILTATVIGGLLSQQVRQIAIMKAVGALPFQVAGIYLALVAALGLLALAIGIPAGVAGGRGLIAVLANMLNLRIESVALPWSLYAGVVLLGVLVPAAAALAPITVAARATVQAALQDNDVNRRAPSRLARALLRLPAGSTALTLAIRNMFRRRARFLLTMLLLAGASAMFLTSMNLRAAWEGTVSQARADRRFDLELRIRQGAPASRVLALISALPAVARAESWSVAPSSRQGKDQLEVVPRYPDGGHGSFALREAQPDTALLAHAINDGRWLRSDDGMVAVLNTQAAGTIFAGVRPGQYIVLKVHGRPVRLLVVGIMRELLAGGAVYVSPYAFAAATGTAGSSNAVRVALRDPALAAATAHTIVAMLEREQIAVSAVLTESSFGAAQGGHIVILVWALGFIAAMMALVGLLGLASSLGSSVLERTREFGIMRAIGAPSRTVVASVVLEGVLTGVFGAGIGMLAAVLPSAVVGNILASISNQALSLKLSGVGALLWLGFIVIAALVASYTPATRASQLTIKQTLDWETA